jgi:hypothetical protein
VSTFSRRISLLHEITEDSLWSHVLFFKEILVCSKVVAPISCVLANSDIQSDLVYTLVASLDELLEVDLKAMQLKIFELYLNSLWNL